MQTTTACPLEGDDLTALGNKSQPFIVSKEHTTLAKTPPIESPRMDNNLRSRWELARSWSSIRTPDKGNFRPKLVRKKK